MRNLVIGATLLALTACGGGAGASSGGLTPSTVPTAAPVASSSPPPSVETIPAACIASGGSLVLVGNAPASVTLESENVGVVYIQQNGGQWIGYAKDNGTATVDYQQNGATYGKQQVTVQAHC